MQPVQLTVAILLGLAALAYILYPLYRNPATRSEATTQAGALRLSEREQGARQALQEVEFDFQLGNLDESEYRALRTRYMGRALLEMKQRQQREQEIDAEIEKQLQMLKAAEQNEQT